MKLILASGLALGIFSGALQAEPLELAESELDRVSAAGRATVIVRASNLTLVSTSLGQTWTLGTVAASATSNGAALATAATLASSVQTGTAMGSTIQASTMAVATDQ
jgi:hypothetical protein